MTRKKERVLLGDDRERAACVNFWRSKKGYKKGNLAMVCYLGHP